MARLFDRDGYEPEVWERAPKREREVDKDIRLLRRLLRQSKGAIVQDEAGFIVTGE